MRRLNRIAASSDYSVVLGRFCAAVLATEAAFSPYTNNYFGGHCRALQNVYPTVCAQLGTETFTALARVYVVHYPPGEWDLNLYGQEFAALLGAQVRGGRAAVFPWRLLAGIARIEFAITRAYYCEDRTDAGAIVAPVDTQGLPETAGIIEELRQQHRVADIDCHLTVDRPIAIWREGLHVRVGDRAAMTSPGKTRDR